MVTVWRKLASLTSDLRKLSEIPKRMSSVPRKYTEFLRLNRIMPLIGLVVGGPVYGDSLAAGSVFSIGFRPFIGFLGSAGTGILIAGLGIAVVLLALRVWKLQGSLAVKSSDFDDQVEKGSAHLKGILNQLPVPLFLQRQDGGMVFANRAMTEFFGKSVEDFEGVELSDFLADSVNERLRPWDEVVQWAEGVRTQQATVLNQYGEKRNVTLVLTEDTAKTGLPQESVGVMTDNTEGEKALQAMADSLDLMTKVTSQVPGVVFEFKRSSDGEFVFPWASVGLQNVFGVSPFDVEGDASFVFDKIHPEDLVRMLQDIENSRSEFKPWKGEYRLRGQIGSERWVLVDAVPEPESQGGTVWHGFTADITDIKKIENQLIHATDEAERANKAKSAFLAAMSHEIRTPMNGVIGMTSLLAQTDLNEEQSGYVSTIRNSGDSLIVVINDILDFSKIESGHLDLEVSPFEISECIEGVVDILTPAATKKELSLAYFVDKATPLVIDGDVMRTRQILVNLVGNAIKFTSEGQVFIHVDLVELDRRKYIRVAVEDSGPGIPESRKGHLFKPFTQVDASTSRVFGGTGLGLAISKRLATLMDGDLSFESVEGEGSSFYVLLPVNEDPKATRVYSKYDVVCAPMAEKEILILDTCPLHREVLSCYAKAWRMRPLTVRNSVDARKSLSEKPGRFDCLIVDQKSLKKELSDTQIDAFLKEVVAQGTRVIEISELAADHTRKDVVPLAKPLKAPHVINALHIAFCKDRSSLKSEPALRVATLHSPPAGLKILLAEDNLVNQKVATMMLKKIGLSADIAMNGREALEACSAKDYHVVLMDVQMPELDGLQATREIRTKLSKPDLWIIGLTANATNSDREAALGAGMNDYLAKPIKIAELSAALSDAADTLGVVATSSESAASSAALIAPS